MLVSVEFMKAQMKLIEQARWNVIKKRDERSDRFCDCCHASCPSIANNEEEIKGDELIEEQKLIYKFKQIFLKLLGNCMFKNMVQNLKIINRYFSVCLIYL